MRWLAAFVVAMIATVALLVLFMGHGIGGCDCGPDDEGLFCWLCEHQLLCAVFATSPLWATALLKLRASMRRHSEAQLGQRQPSMRILSAS
jgi:hypothetical protein